MGCPIPAAVVEGCCCCKQGRQVGLHARLCYRKSSLALSAVACKAAAVAVAAVEVASASSLAPPPAAALPLFSPKGAHCCQRMVCLAAQLLLNSPAPVLPGEAGGGSGKSEGMAIHRQEGSPRLVPQVRGVHARKDAHAHRGT